MIKTSLLANQLLCPQHSALTPIRDYENDYFHINDDKLPSRSNTFACRTDIRRKNITSRSKTGLRRLRNPSLPDILEGSGGNTEVDSMDDILSRFVATLEDMYDSEERYIQTMKLANSVYRKELVENDSFRTKLLERGSNDELLLFGNIETIVSISEIFLTSLKSAILDTIPTDESGRTGWREVLHDKAKSKILHSNLNLEEVALQHLSRVKLTYNNYAAAYYEQMCMFEKLQTTNRDHYMEWYENCLKRAKYERLENIFALPTGRPGQWLQFLELMSELGSKNGLGEHSEKLGKVCDGFRAFRDMIERELKEYEVNEKYDFALTPTDIIQTYSLSPHYPDSEPPDYIDTQNHLIESCVADDDDTNTQGHSVDNILFDMGSLTTTIPRPPTKSSTKDSKPDKISSDFQNLHAKVLQSDLPKNIIEFRRICKGLTKLRTMIHRFDFFTLPNLNFKNVTVWRKMLQLELKPSEILQFDTEREQLVLSMAESYTEKIKAMKEQVTVLKLVDLELSVLYPITVVLKNYDTIVRKLNDLKTLRKDYLMYLKERKTNVSDVKRNLLGGHYESLQTSLTQQLPRFNYLAMRTVDIIVMNYNNVMIKYYKILSGGDSILKKDTEKIQADLGKYGQLHFDLLQSYAKSRHYMKKAVHRNWRFDGDPNESRVVRKLFEL